MNILKKTAVFGLAIVASGSMALAANLPKSATLVSKMGMGFNIGNTLEVPANQGGPTAWGNPMPSQAYVDSIKAAGFNTVRLPTAWYSHVVSGKVNKGWIDTVQTIVDMCIKDGLYVVLNSHWDTGWLEDKVFPADSATVIKNQKAIWGHLANRFKDYDEHLIFASANEPGVNDPWNGGADNGQQAFDAARMQILQRYHQVMIDEVRKSGGNNATRTVVFQMPRTEIDKYQLLSQYYPKDPAGDGYTMAEAHFYPYQFSLMKADESWGKMFYFWEDETTGDASRTCANDALGSKKSIETQLGKLKTAFVDKGIPVIIGEMGAQKRLTLEGQDLEKHLLARAAWYGYVAKIAKADGIVPIIWDTGAEDNLNMTVIRRQKNVDYTIFDYEVLNAMRAEYGLSALDGNSIDAKVEASISTDNKSSIAFFKTPSTSSANTPLRINNNIKDWSKYESATVRIYSDMTATGWAKVSFVTMSGNDWDWKEAAMTVTNGAWASVNVDISNIKTLSQVNATIIFVNAQGMTGKLAVDYIVLNKKGGGADTLESFKSTVFECTPDEGVVVPDEIGSIKTDDVASATTTGAASGKTVNYVFKANSYTDNYTYSETVTPASSNSATPASSNSNTNNKPGSSNSTAIATPAIAQNVHFSAEHGTITATFIAITAGRTTVSLMNSLGQVIASKNMNATRGTNSVSLETSYQGTAFLVIRQGSQKMVKAIRLK